MPSHAIRVGLVDDHDLFREGIRDILNAHADVTVVGEAGDAAAAVRLVGDKKPDVLLLDVDIPGGYVTDTVGRAKALSPDTRVVILTMLDEAKQIRELVRAGISAYLLKSASRHELVATIRTAAASPERCVLSISRDSLALLVAGDPAPDSSATPLTSRECEVLELAAQAFSNAQIATRTGMSEATVKRHLRNVFAKLEAVSRIDAVNRAVAAGLIAAPGPAGH
ncbi:response regulator transcription factor [Microlunatus ginsengisoli]|uniref:Response regulator transcription factor n=2 Tax=Microlunatus ginsengisoli TaxID=363863 RepID=A0ABP7AGJ0_9ACTN